jgi:hypothetical protein
MSCTCGCTERHTLATRETIDGGAIRLDSDGYIWLQPAASPIWSRLPRGNIDSGWRFIEAATLMDSTEIRAAWC